MSELERRTLTLEAQHRENIKKHKEGIDRLWRIEREEHDRTIYIIATISAIAAIVGIAFLGWKLI